MRFRCINQKCGKLPKGFEFEADVGICPKCGWFGDLHVIPLIDVHYLAADDSGPIYGSNGRFFVACEPKRDGLALHSHDQYSATGHPQDVTCRSCRGTHAWKEAAQFEAKFDRRFALQLALEQRGMG